MEPARGAPVGVLGLVCSYRQAMAIRHKDLAADAPRRGMLRGEGPGAGQCLPSPSIPPATQRSQPPQTIKATIKTVPSRPF